MGIPGRTPEGALLTNVDLGETLAGDQRGRLSMKRALLIACAFGLAPLVVAGVYARTPAVIVAMDARTDCELRVARLDARRYDAMKRIYRLRGALGHLKYAIQGAKARGEELPLLSDLHSTIVAALEADEAPDAQ